MDTNDDERKKGAKKALKIGLGIILVAFLLPLMASDFGNLGGAMDAAGVMGLLIFFALIVILISLPRLFSSSSSPPSTSLRIVRAASYTIVACVIVFIILAVLGATGRLDWTMR